MSTAVQSEAKASQVVAFRLGHDEYAVDIQQVQEIIRHTEPRAMPGSPPEVLGVINLRGRLIPVVDLAALLGAAAAAPADAKIVVVALPGATAGLVVDEVTEVRQLVGDQLEPAPGDGAARAGVQSVARLEDRLMVVLDLEMVLGAGRLDGLGA